MIQAIHIIALSNRGFVERQLQGVFCGGRCGPRRDSFWNGQGLGDPAA